MKMEETNNLRNCVVSPLFLYFPSSLSSLERHSLDDQLRKIYFQSWLLLKREKEGDCSFFDLINIEPFLLLQE